MAHSTRERENKLPGPNIVQAWFHTVFQYLLRGLEMERNLLERHNWTWRFRPPGLQSFVPVRQHVVPEAWDNLDQLLRFHPEIAPFAERHDHALQNLLESCQAYHTALVDSQALSELYGKIKTECQSTIGGAVSDHFGAYSQEEDFRAVLAQNIVNNVGELPSYYATSRLWNHYQDDLLALQQLPGVEPRYRATEEAGAELKQAVTSLLGVLRETREKLSLEFDVPFVAEVPLLR